MLLCKWKVNGEIVSVFIIYYRLKWSMLTKIARCFVSEMKIFTFYISMLSLNEPFFTYRLSLYRPLFSLQIRM